MKKQSRINNAQSTAKVKAKPDFSINKPVICLAIVFLQLFVCKTLAKRFISVVMLACGRSVGQVSESTGLSERTVRGYKKDIADGNTEKLFQQGKGGGRKGSLEALEQDIKNEIQSNNYQTFQAVVDMIGEKFGIKTSLSAVKRLLKKLGLKRFKCGSLPAKADVEAQRTFLDTVLTPLMEFAKVNGIALFFVDASHFVLGSDYLGYIFGTARRFVKTFSGRQRFNVLGALNFMSKKLTKVTNDKYITATDVCELLRRLASEYVEVPIFIVLDNARYQKCKLVQEVAAELGINLVYIPPYSPNLNLIERFWKYVKGELRTKYYDNFQEFCAKILSIIECDNDKSKKKVERLITGNIQMYDDLRLINGSTFAKDEALKRAA
jgi:transposase